MINPIKSPRADPSWLKVFAMIAPAQTQGIKTQVREDIGKNLDNVSNFIEPFPTSLDESC
jgi:hypothetical protein